MSNRKKGLGRRTTALLWFAAIGILIGFLIYFEQIALLYVLATVGLVVLLLIVGFSDLENIDRSGFDDYVKPAE